MFGLFLFFFFFFNIYLQSTNKKIVLLVKGKKKKKLILLYDIYGILTVKISYLLSFEEYVLFFKFIALIYIYIYIFRIRISYVTKLVYCKSKGHIDNKNPLFFGGLKLTTSIVEINSTPHVLVSIQFTKEKFFFFCKYIILITKNLYTY